MKPNSTIDIQARIRGLLVSLEPQTVELLDESGLHVGHAGAKGGGHFRLLVVSPQFAGHSRVARHRMVYTALQSLMQQEIHALALTARAPGES